MKKRIKIFYHKLIAARNKIRKIFLDRKTSNFFKELIGNGRLVFDIGANTGVKTKIFNKLGNKVIAVEPQNNLCELLKKEFASNRDVVIVHNGISDHEGELTLNISSRYPGFSSFDAEWQKGTKYESFDRKEKVGMITLDTLIERYGLPYYCKIDVEGFEKEVIKGLTQKIPLLSFEFHSSDFGPTKECLDLLGKLGYQKFNYDLCERAQFDDKKWMDKTELIEKITGGRNEHRELWGDIYCK
ncbi:MAG: FkbM family methyltransferase [bacterium]|nr:FkbM family methyltransferase [bacterium]